MHTATTRISHPLAHGHTVRSESPGGSAPSETLEAAEEPRPGSAPLAPLFGGDRLVVTVAEAAELLGISRAFAYELVARNELPVLRLGRRIVVPKAALLAMLGVLGTPS